MYMLDDNKIMIELITYISKNSKSILLVAKIKSSPLD